MWELCPIGLCVDAHGARLIALSGEVTEPSAGRDSLGEVGKVIGQPHFLSQLSAFIYQDVTTCEFLLP